MADFALNRGVWGTVKDFVVSLWTSAKNAKGKQAPERYIRLHVVGNSSSLALCLAR